MPQASFFNVKISEADVMDEVKKFLDLRGVWWWRNTLGCFKKGPHYITVGPNGSSDLFAFWPGDARFARGTFWGIELKKPKGAFENDDQIRWIIDTRMHGGIASVCESVEDVTRALDDPLYLPERYQKAVDEYKKLHGIR